MQNTTNYFVNEAFLKCVGLYPSVLTGNRNLYFWWLFGFRNIAWPNKLIKGTRRPLAVLKFRFLSRFGGFVLAH